MSAVLAYRTPADAPVWRRRLLLSPLARIVIFIVLVAAVGFLVHGLLSWLGWMSRSTPRPQAIAGAMLQTVVPTVFAYAVLVRWIERRRARELATGRPVRDLLAGLAAGAGYMAAVVGVLWLLGAYEVVDTRTGIPFAGSLLIAGVATGIAEEIVFRGVLFRVVEEGLGTWAALVASALLFGFAHIHNPGATVWSSLAIAIEAGLLLGMVYQVTRSLLLCMALHAAWNFTQGTVFGVAVSGLPSRNSWLVPRMHGPDWLTGGAFGLEASVVAAGLGALAAALLVLHAARRGTLVPWRPRSLPAAAPAAPDNGLPVLGTPPC
ncbi:MAG: CPBP family intramembrane glutamic endopeptidase [Ramlibacter sp.]